MVILQMNKGGWVYILTNQRHTVLYVGVTSDLVVRIQEHRQKLFPRSFTARYNVEKLIYYRSYDRIELAIANEKRLKGCSRKLKESLIEDQNPGWKDLWVIEISKW